MSSLTQIADEYLPIFTSMGLKTEARRLKSAKERLAQKGFRVLVTGEYSRGKSMLLNALLGEEILATSLLRLPVRNRIISGPGRSARAGQAADLHAVALSDLAELREAPMVELTWDGPFFQGDLELREYPSMSEAPNREEFIAEVEQADLVVVVVASDALYSNTESHVVESVIKGAGHQRLIFVANLIDRIAPKDLEEVQRIARVRLPVNADRIFYLSSQRAIEGNPEALADVAALRDKISEEATNRNALRADRLRHLLETILDTADAHLSDSTKTNELENTRVGGEISRLRKGLRSVQELFNEVQQELQAFRKGTQEVAQEKVGYFLRGLSSKVKDWGKAAPDKDLDGYINRNLKSELDHFVERDFNAYLASRFEQQESLLTNGLARYREQINVLYDLLGEKRPELQLRLPPGTGLQSLGTVSIGEKGLPEREFDIRRLMAVPEAMITVVGTIVGSILLAQPLLIPVGLLLAGYWAIRIGRAKAQEKTLQHYAAQLEEKARALETQVSKQVGGAIDDVQQQVVQWLKSTLQTVQDLSRQKIDLLEKSLGETNPAAPQANLDRLRAVLKNL